MTSSAIDVLVVGAGPVGLTLALQANDHGAKVRVVERRPQAFRASRALIVHARTLEVLRPLGVTETLLARGDVAPSIHLHVAGREIPVRLGDFAIADTPFPHLLFERQALLEETLAEALLSRGVEVERGIELDTLVARDAGMLATLTGRGTREVVAARFVAGCDGPGSTVRRLAGIDWRGAAYRQEVVLADIEIDGRLPTGTAHAVPAPSGVVFLFSPGEHATWRLLATRDATGPGAPNQPGAAVPLGELQALLDGARLDVQVVGVAWSARVPLEHRIAASYRRGPLFLVGDAAHVHSPAGGQGMNTGIQDAVNLGWKLAFAARIPRRDAAEATLLDSYEAERRPVAFRTLALTHAIFWAEAGTGTLAGFVRGDLVPLGAPLLPHVLRRRRLLAGVVRVLSQLALRYHHSPLAIEGDPSGGPGPRPGARMPDGPITVPSGRARVHELLATPGLHVLLASDGEWPIDVPPPPYTSVHRITEWPGRGLVLVRPDGYVGLRSATGGADDLRRWLRLVGAAEHRAPVVAG